LLFLRFDNIVLVITRNKISFLRALNLYRASNASPLKNTLERCTVSCPHKKSAGCVLLQASLAKVKQLLVASQDYHTVVTTNMALNRTTGWVKGNVGHCAGG